MSIARRLWLIACLFVLSLSFAVTQPAKADTPTGYQSDVAYLAAQGNVNCSDPHSICFGTFSLLDKIFYSAMLVCDAWTAPPVQCTSPLFSTATSNRTGYSADAPTLGYQTWLAFKAYADKTDPSVLDGRAVPSTFGSCTLTSSNPDHYACSTTSHVLHYNATTHAVTYDPDFAPQPIAIAQLSSVSMCAGYFPGLGCPIAGQVERANAIACVTYSGADPQAASMVAPCLSAPSAGNPISVLSGVKVERKTDISWPIEFTRVYSSSRNLTTPHSMGTWSHNHESNLVAVWTNMTSSPNFIAGLTFNLEDGQAIAFKRTSSTSAFAPAYADQSNYLVSSNGTGFVLTLPSKEARQYDAYGNMVTRTFRNGYTLSYVYDNSNRLDQIMDSYGRGITITWSDYAHAIVQVSTISTSSTDTVNYVYSGGNLSSATFNTTEAVSYGYDSSGRLVGITDALGKTYSQYGYNGSGQANMSSAVVGGVVTNEVDVAYGSNTVSVSENGATSVYTTAKDGTAMRTRIASATLGGTASSYSLVYDAQGRPTGSSVGALTESYTVDPVTFLPLTKHCADGGTVTFTWDTANRLLTKVVEPSARGSRTINMAYDANGNLLTRQVVGAVGGTRQWSYTYSTFGKVLTATDPSGAVTSYTYYSDTDSLPERRGQIQSVTNAVGHVVTIAAYDTRANPTSVYDENNVQTTMAYDARGRLLSKSRAGQSISYGYDLQGQVVSTSYSNGYSLTMGYDDAHRMVSVADSNGESKTFGYDGYGNRIQDSIKSGSNLVLQLNRTYTSLRQTKSQWMATPSEAIGASYDTNGRKTGATDGLNRASSYSYSNLGATTGYTELDMSGAFTRDADSNMTGYSSGRYVPGTTYAWNDFKEMTATTSPDSGAQTIANDPAARTTTRVDAAGATHVITKDPIGRIVSSFHSSTAGTMTETLAYDTNGKGYLASATDNASTQTWTWNGFGQPLSKAQSAFGTNLSLTYGYDGQGQLTSIIYPSGMNVGYGWTGGRIASVTVNGAAYISNIAYFPLTNTPVSWTWAAGGSYSKSIDANGKVTGVSDSGVVAQTMSFDGAFRLTGLADTGLSVVPTYSTGDQLASINVNSQTQTFTFDPNWNRASKKYFNGSNEQVSVPYQGNYIGYTRLNGGAMLSYAYDSRGNVTNNGRGVFVYDQRGNLSQSTVGTTVGSYAYNAFNQRVKKTVGANTTIFIYDESSNLAGEYNGSGAMLSEHIYLGSLPIAVNQGGTIYGVHTDYLGTPRVITSGATVVWKWDSTDPFGMNAPSVQTISYNQRFPGQYYDAENGLHSNRYRVYDPYVGRYMQPDPIGLSGGKNAYNYVNANPINGIDPMGLTTQIIRVVDPNTMEVDHIATRVVNDATGVAVIFGAYPEGGYFSGIFSGGVGTIVMDNDTSFKKRYENKSFTYNVITLNTTPQEEETIKNSFTDLSRINVNFSVLPGIGVSCVTSTDITMQRIGLPRLAGQSAWIKFHWSDPAGYEANLLSTKEYLNRIKDVKLGQPQPY